LKLRVELGNRTLFFRPHAESKEGQKGDKKAKAQERQEKEV
jgi:hypothetical protein